MATLKSFDKNKINLVLQSVLNKNCTFNSIQYDTKISPRYLREYLDEVLKQGLLESKLRGKRTQYFLTKKGEIYLPLETFFDMFDKIDTFNEVFKIYKNPKKQKEFIKILRKTEKTKNKAILGQLKIFRNSEYVNISEHRDFAEIIDNFSEPIFRKEEECLIAAKVPASKEDYLRTFGQEPPVGEDIADTDNMREIFSEYEKIKTQTVKDVEKTLMDRFKEFFELILYLYYQVENPQEKIKNDYFFFGPDMQLLFNFDSRCLGDEPEFSKNNKEFEARFFSLWDFCSWRYMLSGKG